MLVEFNFPSRRPIRLDLVPGSREKRVWYHLIIVLVYLVGFKPGPRSHSLAPLGSLAHSLQVGGDASVLLRSALTYMQSTAATHGHGSSTHASHCIIGCLLELVQ